MFCPICGKKIEEGNRFCDNCGFDTDSLAVGKEGASAAPAAGAVGGAASDAAATSGTVSEAASGAATAPGTASGAASSAAAAPSPEAAARFQQVQEKLVSSVHKANVLALIAKILLFAVPAYMIWTCIRHGDGTGVIISIVISIVLFYVYVYFVRGYLQMSKKKLGKEYLNAISYIPFTEIANMLQTSACPVVKAVQYNPYANSIHVALKGGKEIEFRKGEADTTVIESLKGNLDELLQDTLIVYLAKQITPSLDFDKYKTYKNNSLWKKGEVLSCAFLVAAFILYMVISLTEDVKEQYIAGIRDHVVDEYEITYGEAFDRVFDSGKWKYFNGDNDVKVVEYAGKVNGHSFTLQWVVKPKDNGMVEYEYYTMELDDEPLNILEQAFVIGFIMKEAAEDDNNFDLDELEDDLKDGYSSIESTDRQMASSGQEGAKGGNNQYTGPLDYGQGSNGNDWGGEAEFMEYDSRYEELEGEWYDMGRCHVYLESTGKAAYNIIVEWGSSAWETAVWQMDAEYESDMLWYTNAVSGSLIYDDNGNESFEQYYEGGEGCFILYDDDTLHWTSYVESDYVDDMILFRQ